MMPVRSRLVAAGLIAAASLALAPRMDAQRRTAVPDLQGIWLSATSTPLQRPANMRDKAKFTPEEAEAYRRGTEDRLRARLPGDADRVVIRQDVLEEEDGPMLKYGIQSMNGRVLILPKRREDRPDQERLAARYHLVLLPESVAAVRAAGCAPIAINAHHLAEMVAAFAAEEGLAISQEEAILGTAGGLAADARGPAIRNTPGTSNVTSAWTLRNQADLQRG